MANPAEGHEEAVPAKLDVAGVHKLLSGSRDLITDSHLKSICTASELTELDISHCHRITVKGYEALVALKNLGRLDISGLRIDKSKMFSVLTKLPSLRELRIKNVGSFKGSGLGQLKSLTHLDISNEHGGVSDNDLVEVGGLTSLVHLKINGSRSYRFNNRVTDKGLKHLEGLTSLEYLGLYGHTQISGKGYGDLCRNLKKLKSLEMGFNWPLKGNDLDLPGTLEHLNMMESFQLQDAAVINLKNKTRLKRLNLYYCLELTDKSLESLKDLPGLESLNIGSIRALTDEGMMSLKGNTGLTYLNLCDNDNLTDKCLTALTNMTQLKELNMWNVAKLKGDGLSVLSGMTQLKTLNVSGCPCFTDEGLRHVKGTTSLEQLHLDHCGKLTDQGLSHLSDLTKLQELTLGSCVLITDNGLEYLKTLSSLEYCDLTGCVGLSLSGVKALRKALPKCNIVY